VTSAVVALLVTAGLAPLVRSLMLRQGIIDVPNHRSSHSVPTPRGGGWACILGLLVASVVSAVRDVAVPWWVLAAALVLGVVGFLDDRRSLPAWIRLAAQVSTGALVGTSVSGLLGALVGAILYPAVVNVVNFMDGINGITAMTIGFWGATAFVVGRNHHLSALSLVGGITAGVALGFLPWNAPVARLFLGDVGSYLLGALVAGGTLVGWHGHAPVLILLAPLSVYLVDTAATLVARARRREALLEAHRSHVYQRLTSGPRRLPHVVIATYAAVMSATVTMAWAFLPAGAATAVSIAALGLYCASPWLLNRGTTTSETSAEVA
jgi:UDP-N-acetylmuramyl pentapeptide phosphotransferase/UDP-N-acetylglucosamine-1-phosphate transferase